MDQVQEEKKQEFELEKARFEYAEDLAVLICAALGKKIDRPERNKKTEKKITKESPKISEITNEHLEFLKKKHEEYKQSKE